MDPCDYGMCGGGWRAIEVNNSGLATWNAAVDWDGPRGNACGAAGYHFNLTVAPGTTARKMIVEWTDAAAAEGLCIDVLGPAGVTFHQGPDACNHYTSTLRIDVNATRASGRVDCGK